MFDYYNKKKTNAPLSLTPLSHAVLFSRVHSYRFEEEGRWEATTQTTGKVRSKVYGGALVVWSCLLVNDVYLLTSIKI